MLMYGPELIREVIFLWSTGMPVETICDCVGLSPEEVNSIIDEVGQYV
jgi:hypothetical protein